MVMQPLLLLVLLLLLLLLLLLQKIYDSVKNLNHQASYTAT
jgi:hypothetical protein